MPIKQKPILDNLRGAIIDRPAPARLTRYNLVGIPFEMSISETVCSIIDDISNWLNLVKSSDNSLALKDNPLSYIYIHDINKCKNSEVYRAAISISVNMIATLGQRKL